MRRGLVNVIFLFLIGLFAINLIGCSNTTKKVVCDKNFEKTIDEKLNQISHSENTKLLLSSNPYDYIKDSSQHSV